MPQDHALSDTVSVTIIISLVVILIIITAALLFGNLNLQQKSAYVLSEMNNKTITNTNMFLYYHKAGDDVFLNSSSPGLHEMAFYVDNRTSTKRARPVPGLNTVTAGTLLYIYYNATQDVYRISSTMGPAELSDADTAEDCPLRIRIVDESARISLGTWNWSCEVKPVILTGPAPTVGYTNPASGYRGFPIVRGFNGTNFLDGATAMLNRTGGIPPEIPADSCTVLNATWMDCIFTLPPSALAPTSQRYNLVVTNPDGKQGMRANYFYVYTAAPYIYSGGSTPASGIQGATITITNLRGNYYQPTASVVYWQGTGTTIPLGSVTVRNMTSLTGTLAIPATAPSGYYNITVTNGDGRSYTRANQFRVRSNAPTVTGITNRTGYLGSLIIGNITGTNFVNGATARFNSTTLGDIASTSCIFVSNTSLKCTFDPAGKPVSASNGYNVVVKNPDGKEGMRASYFTLSARVPTVSGITNRSGYRGWLVIENVTGSNFLPGATVRFNHSTLPDISPVTPCTYVSETRLSCVFDMATRDPTPTYTYNVVVKNPDDVGGREGMRASYFWIQSPGPTISSSTNRSGGQGTTVAISRLAGNYFQPDTEVTYWRGAETLTFTPLSRPDRTTITGTLTVPATATIGYYNITVRNPYDGKTATLRNGFRVYALPPPAVSGISPSTGDRGVGVDPVIVSWTGFKSGASVRLYNGSTMVYSTTTHPSLTDTQISTSFNVPETVIKGTMNLRVYNPD
ncbi:MAG: hypothetical protein GYA23_00485, partial [Methanomicrobiales archaeon]|nr:hypothetical protein [Methanomicrobiales archaeon]